MTLLERMQASPVSEGSAARQTNGGLWLMGQAFAEQPPERKGRGRPTREDQELPPKIQQALVLRAAGASWIDCAAGAGVDVAT